METLIDSAGSDDPRQALAAAAELRRQAERLQDTAARSAVCSRPPRASRR